MSENSDADIPFRFRGICRTCGERYDPNLPSYNIFEELDGNTTFHTYAQILNEFSEANRPNNIYVGDKRPNRIGIACAKKLDEMISFKEMCIRNDAILKKKLRKQKNAAQQKNSTNAEEANKVKPGPAKRKTATANSSTETSSSSKKRKL